MPNETDRKRSVWTYRIAACAAGSWSSRNSIIGYQETVAVEEIASTVEDFVLASLSTGMGVLDIKFVPCHSNLLFLSSQFP